jgi:hypothetical protein
VRDVVDNRQLYHLAGQQAQRPARSTFRWLSASECDQPRLTSAIQLSSCRRLFASLSFQRRIESFFDESLSNVSYRVRANPERLRGLLVSPTRATHIDLQ